MANKRRAEAIWIEAKGYWQVKVQKDGTRKGFTSSIKGRKGKHAAEAAADEWLEKGTSDMRFSAAWKAFMDVQLERTGTANAKSSIRYIGCIYRRISLIANWRTLRRSCGKNALTQRRSADCRSAPASTFARQSMNLLGLRSDRAGTFSDLKRVISSSRRTQRPAKKRSFSSRMKFACCLTMRVSRGMVGRRRRTISTHGDF